MKRLDYLTSGSKIYSLLVIFASTNFLFTSCRHHSKSDISNTTLPVRFIDTILLDFPSTPNILDVDFNRKLILFEDEIDRKIFITDLRGNLKGVNDFYGNNKGQFTSFINSAGFTNDSTYLVVNKEGYFEYSLSHKFIKSDRVDSFVRTPNFNRKLYFADFEEGRYALHSFLASFDLLKLADTDPLLWPYQSFRNLTIRDLKLDTSIVKIGLPDEYETEFYQSFFDFIVHIDPDEDLILAIFNPLPSIFTYTYELSPRLVERIDLNPRNFNGPKHYQSIIADRALNSRFARIFSSNSYFYILYSNGISEEYSEELEGPDMIRKSLESYTSSLILFNKNMKYLSEYKIPKEMGYLQAVSPQDELFFLPNPHINEKRDYSILPVAKLKL